MSFFSDMYHAAWFLDCDFGKPELVLNAQLGKIHA